MLRTLAVRGAAGAAKRRGGGGGGGAAAAAGAAAASRRGADKSKGTDKVAEALEPCRVVLDWSEADLQAMSDAARAYSKVRWHENADRQRRTALLARARRRAEAELPPEQHEHARKPDFTSPPLTRWMPTETPPIPGHG